MARWNIALRHAHGAVHVIRSILIQAVEVSTGTLVAQLFKVSSMLFGNTSRPYRVVQIHNDPVTFGEVEQRWRPLTIDANDRALKHAIGIGPDPPDVQIMSDGRRVEAFWEECEQTDQEERQ